MFGKYSLWFFAIQLAAAASPPTHPPKGPPPPRLLLQIEVFPAAYAIRTLAFSPDERWVGILGEDDKGIKNGRGDFESALLLFPGPAPQDQPLPHPVRIDRGMPIFWGPVWSPGSDSVLVGEPAGPDRGVAKLFSIAGGQLWARDVSQSRSQLIFPPPRPYGEVFGFLASDRLIAEFLDKRRRAAFSTLDLQGEVTDAWPVPKKWTIAAVSPETHLLAVYSDDYRAKTLIIDYSSRKIIQSKKNPAWLYRNGDNALVNVEFFTEAGKTLCVVASGTHEESPAECWNVDTGSKVGEFRGLFGGAPAAGSAHDSRLVLTQTRLPSGDVNRIVWDFRTGAELAAWPAPGQIIGPHGLPQTAPVAISSTGRYIAEGGNGILRVYELP